MQDGQPEPGDIIAGKYVIERVLGRGGMGTVYAVVHRETGKRLALKCLLPEYVNNPNVVERFVREAKAVGRIHHRHVIDVFDQGRDEGVLFIVLPLLEGKPLSELLHDETLTLEETLLILVRAMEGVSAANARGVLHRDLKPSNIFVCLGVSGLFDDPRVLDFGISKLAGEADMPLTRSGVAVGTPCYMSLEQLTGQRDLDARVDVYAMGVILYEAISGAVPHVAENAAALALRLMHVPPVHLFSRRPELSPQLAAVVMRALSRDRDHRHASMRELIDAIVPFIPDAGGLFVREPEGTPLRTPRNSGKLGMSDGLAAATATTKSAVSPHGAFDSPAAPVSAQNSAPPPRTKIRLSLGLASLAVLSAAVLAYFAFPVNLAPATRAAPKAAPTTIVRSAAAKDVQKSSVPPSAQAVVAPTANDGGTHASDASANIDVGPSNRRRRSRPSAVSAETPRPTVEPTPATPPSTTWRAGGLSFEEF